MCTMTARPACSAPQACLAAGKGHCRACQKIFLENNPEARARRSAASKKALADPEVRARRSAAQKKAWADPEVRARRSAAMKKALADPEVRARMSAAQKKALADPEVRARRSAAVKKAWADPEARARMSAAVKKTWADKNSWCPPERREEYRFLVSKLGAREARDIIINSLHPSPRDPAELAGLAVPDVRGHLK